MTKLTKEEQKLYYMANDLGFWFDFILDNDELYQEYQRIKQKVEQIREERKRNK